MDVKNRWSCRPSFYVLEHSDGWELRESVTYTPPDPWRQSVTIPAGFKTDFASIPRPVRGLIGVNGKHRLAALLHDYLYSGPVKRGDMHRRRADQYFLDEMKLSNVKIYKAIPMYWAVRLFGGWYTKTP